MHELDHRRPCLGGDGIYPKVNGELNWNISLQTGVRCQDSLERSDYGLCVQLEGDCRVEPQLVWRNEIVVEADGMER